MGKIRRHGIDSQDSGSQDSASQDSASQDSASQDSADHCAGGGSGPNLGGPALMVTAQGAPRAWLGLLLAMLMILQGPWALLGQESPPIGIGPLYRKGLNHLRRNEPAEAEAAWQALLRRAPNHFNAHLGLGKLLLGQAPGRAGPHLKAAADLRPASDAAHYHLGRYLEGRDRLLEAAEQFRKAIKLNARHYSANARLRKVIRKLRSRQSVVERAAEQLWTNPNLASLTLFGKIVMNRSTPRQALLEFELVQQRLPEMPEVQLWIARAHRRLGSLQGEIAAYRVYMARNKGAVGVQLLMLERLLEAGQFRGAETPLAGLEARRTELGRKNLGRLLFLKSLFLVARGHSRQAGQALLAAAAENYDTAKVGPAFQDIVTRFPEQTWLWLDYGAWLKQQRRLEAAVEAYYKAAKAAGGATPDEAAAGQALRALRAFADTKPGMPAANLALGELALERGDQAMAVARLERIPPGHKKDGRAALLLGAVFRSQGELDKALDAFTRYVFSFPDRAGMAFARGNLFWVIGKHDIAVGRWTGDLDAIKNHPEALSRMAGYHRTAGDSRRELTIREHLRTAAPHNLTNRIRLGDLLAAQDRQADAAAEWEYAAGLKTGDFALLVRLGKAYLELRQQDKGISALRRAAQIGDLDPPLAERLARQLLARKQWAEALDFYWQIYRSRPDHPDLPRALPTLVMNAPARPEQSLAAARYAEASAQSELAIELLEELLRLHADQGEARIMLARLYMTGGEPAEAERILTEGGGIEGISEVKSLRALARVQRFLRKREPLAQTLARILMLAPDDAAMARELGLLLMKLKKPGAARPHLATSLKANAEDAQVLYQMARAEFLLKRSAEAEAGLERLFALEAGHAEGQRLHIRILHVGRQWEKLIDRLEGFVGQFPDDADARYDLISAYLNLFDPEKARPHYEILKAGNPAKVRALHDYFK